jgi:hypothetical protein
MLIHLLVLRHSRWFAIWGDLLVQGIRNVHIALCIFQQIFKLFKLLNSLFGDGLASRGIIRTSAKLSIRILKILV